MNKIYLINFFKIKIEQHLYSFIENTKFHENQPWRSNYLLNSNLQLTVIWAWSLFIQSQSPRPAVRRLFIRALSTGNELLLMMSSLCSWAPVCGLLSPLSSAYSSSVCPSWDCPVYCNTTCMETAYPAARCTALTSVVLYTIQLVINIIT